MPASCLRSPRVYTPTLTGLGERAHLLRWEVDSETHVQDVLGLLECEDLYEVALVGHSAGSMIIDTVADRMTDRIASLTYLDGALIEQGSSLLEIMEKHDPQIVQAALKAMRSVGDGWRVPPLPASAFGITEASLASWVDARLKPLSFASVNAPLKMSRPGRDLPRTYIACTNPPYSRTTTAAAAIAKSKPWRYYELNACHDAMLTEPTECTRILVDQ